MGKKKLGKIAGTALAPVSGGLSLIASKQVEKYEDREAKKKAQQAQEDADNAVLTEEANKTTAADAAYEEEKKKKQQATGLGSVIGSNSTLG